MENSHIVGRFDRDLKNIQSRVLAMGELVGTQLRDATTVLTDPLSEEISRIVATDRQVNRMNGSISDRCERLIALRQPMAADLREALSPISVAAELERIGDHAKSTAKKARKLGNERISPALFEIISHMSSLVVGQLGDVLRAYRDEDVPLSRDIFDKDREVDALNKNLLADAVSILNASEADANTVLQAVLISRNLERAGDHVVNIARHNIHIVTGANTAGKDKSDGQQSAK